MKRDYDQIKITKHLQLQKIRYQNLDESLAKSIGVQVLNFWKSGYNINKSKRMKCKTIQKYYQTEECQLNFTKNLWLLLLWF